MLISLKALYLAIGLGLPSFSPVKTLEDFVKISSGSADRAGVNEVQTRLSEELKAMGFVVRRMSGPEGAGDLWVGELKRGSEEFVTLLTHVDTVFEKDSGFQGFQLSADKQSAVGPGVIDAKGGVVVALQGLHHFLNRASQYESWKYSIRFVSSPSEEVGSVGFQDEFRRLAKDSRFVFTFEPGRDDGSILKSRKGNRWYEITTTGVAAHAGEYHARGVNACVDLAEKLVEVSKLTDYSTGLTVNVGAMHGGVDKFNIVCPKATAKVDLRFRSLAQRDRAHQKIVKILENAGSKNADGRRTQTAYQIVDDSPPLEFRQTYQRHLDRYLQILEDIEGQKRGASDSGGSADSAYFSNENTFVMDGLGPYGSGMHTIEETVNLASLETRALAFGRFLTEIQEVMPVMKTLSPPKAAEKKHRVSIHGEAWNDPYFWLRNRKNPAVIQYLKAENRYTESVMASTEKLRTELFDEIKGRVKQTDATVPAKWGAYYYYSRIEEGKQYRIYCRKFRSLNAPEEILLDINELAKGRPFAMLGAFRVSPDHRLLAYSMDFKGDESSTVYVKDLETGRLLTDQIKQHYYGLEWGEDSKTLYYTTHDDTHRPYRVFRHILGQKASQDEKLFEEKDLRFYLQLSKTSDNKYILLKSGSKTSHETHFLNTEDSRSTFQLFAKRKKDVRYTIDHGEGLFYILTNEKAQNFKLLKTSDQELAPKFWKEIIAHSPDRTLIDFSLFKSWLVVMHRENGLLHYRIIDAKTEASHEMKFEHPIYDIGDDVNYEYEATQFRYSYSSLAQPKTIIEYDLETRRSRILKIDEIRGGIKFSDYRVSRIWAKASDGVKVPISLVHSKDLKLNGSNPTLLEAYGSYGAAFDPGFDPFILSLLKRGFIYAIAHPRGGGDMGEQWYLNGKMLKKKNTMTDFIACAEHLIAEKYTSANHLTIKGESAGGMLMGAVVNMRPDLFKAVIAGVPFVDVINTMLDEKLPLTVTEFEEWGNPKIRKYYRYMKSYSPYDNVSAKSYPHILVLAGLNDTRVMYWEPAKWVAKLRKLKTDQNFLLLKTQMDSGHGGASGRYEMYKETAYQFAFLLKTMDLSR